jgi:uncharacterized low-complexity protein
MFFAATHTVKFYFYREKYMSASKNTLALVVGSALAATVLSTSVQATENPFSAKPLASGYMVADASNTNKMKDGQCAAGKCGATQKPKKEKAKEGACNAEKMKEGACGSEMRNAAKKDKEGACHAEKAKEGTCHADKK